MNSYGNFVVQNALKYALLDDKGRLTEQVEKVIPSLSDPKIKSKWIALLKRAGENSHKDRDTRMASSGRS